MADATGNPSGGGSAFDPTVTDYDDQSVTLSFSYNLNIVKCGVWWLVWLLALAFAFVRRRVVSRAWFIYTMLLAVICFNGAQTSAYVGFASHALQLHSGLIGYLLYILFFNLSRSTFLGVLMVVASGYCITRSDLGPHKHHVIFVPTTVLVTGLITDYAFFALQSSPTSDTYDLTDMGTLAAAMWFVCSVLNLSALILAWLYIFEALGKEQSALEEEYERRSGKYEEQQRAAAEAEAAAVLAASARPGYAALAPGMAIGVPVPTAANDPEAGAGGGEEGGETVADHMAYTAKKKLMSRFAKGVAAYLLADICVLLLPAFFNHVVQSTLQVLLFVCYLLFIIVLLVLFRPQEQSTYLMVGFSEEDAEKRGVNQLLTGIAMGELPPHGGDSDDEFSRLGATATGSSPLGHRHGASSSTAAGSAPSAPPAASKAATKAAARTLKKAGADYERYGQLAAAPTSNGAGGAAALPVSSLIADTGRVGSGSAGTGPGSSSAAVGSAPLGPSRGRKPRTYVPQPAKQGAGQFTLGDEDDEDAEMSKPLTGERGA